eukprot:612087-Pelagomonas_calceolata.AAC.1
MPWQLPRSFLISLSASRDTTRMSPVVSLGPGCPHAAPPSCPTTGSLSHRHITLTPARTQAVALDAPMLDLTLFLGNLSEGMEDAKLQEEMAKYGELERCFVMRNKEGVSKV